MDQGLLILNAQDEKGSQSSLAVEHLVGSPRLELPRSLVWQGEAPGMQAACRSARHPRSVDSEVPYLGSQLGCLVRLSLHLGKEMLLIRLVSKGTKAELA